MKTLTILSFLTCVVSVAAQSQILTVDCAPFFLGCDEDYEASQKDMTQVNDYYQCLKRIQGCNFVQEEEKERRIVKLKIFVANVCPSCRLGEKVWTTHTPAPDEMPNETCENQIFSCTTRESDSDSMTRFDMLQETFVCVQRPTECSVREEYLRQAVTNSIVTEMAIACPNCLVPNPPPSVHVGDLQPEDIPCMSVMTLCNAKFNVKENNYWSFESLYMCIAKISNCDSDVEKTLRRQQMNVLMMTLRGMCPNCTMLTPKPPERQTCGESVYYCSTHGIYDSFTVRQNALKKVHACALELDECDSTKDNNLRFYLVHQVRIEIEHECGSCSLPHVPAHIMEALDNAMPPQHDDCMEAITSCQSIFNIRARDQRRYEEMYNCIQRADNCTPDEMEQMIMEQPTAEMAHHLIRRKRNALSTGVFKPQIHSKMETVVLFSCLPHIIRCRQEYQTSPGTCRNTLAYVTCLSTITSCQVWEEQKRMEYLAEQFAVIGKDCTPDVKSDCKNEWPSSSCYSSFSSCNRAFYSSARTYQKAEQFYQCLTKPLGCNSWEESYREEMLKAALSYIQASGLKEEPISAGNLVVSHSVIILVLPVLATVFWTSSHFR